MMAMACEVMPAPSGPVAGNGILAGIDCAERNKNCGWIYDSVPPKIPRQLSAGDSLKRR